MPIALSIFALTLLFVIWQPRGLGVGWSASAGALLALAAGVVQFSDVVQVWHIVWNATITFVAIIITSLILDEAGFFKWAALHVARRAGGSGRRLFISVILLGATVTALFANDGAALILTPIVMEMLLALGFGKRAALAYIMAAGFIADTGSLPLTVSNLVNILSADFFDISFARYASVMVPVNIVAVLASLAVLYLYFRRDIPPRFDLAAVPAPVGAIRDPVTVRAGWIVLASLLLAFFVLEPLGIPVSAIASTGAAALLYVAGRQRIVGVRRILRHAPWNIVVFSLGMYIVVYGLSNAGLTSWLTQLLMASAAYGTLAATLVAGFSAALLSSVMNNLPAVLLGCLSIADAHVTPVIKDAMIYANIIGSDLGPKITPIGSLATLLWLHVIARRGFAVGWGYYLQVGIVLTVPVLAVTLIALAWRLS